MVRWVVGSILHRVNPSRYFSFEPVLHDWCNKGCCMCYPVCGMVHIKEPLLLIGKSSLCGAAGFLSHYQNEHKFGKRRTVAPISSSVVKVFAHCAMGGRIDHSWWTHWAISFQPVPHDLCNNGRGVYYPDWDNAYKNPCC